MINWDTPTYGWVDGWVNGWAHVKSQKSNKSWPNWNKSIMDILDIFWTFYLNHLSPLWGYFLDWNITSSLNILRLDFTKLLAINDTVPNYAAILSATFKHLEGHDIKARSHWAKAEAKAKKIKKEMPNIKDNFRFCFHFRSGLMGLNVTLSFE